ncbi:hypothetical protein AB0D04_40210 [Streptomyces sp. NPDC048483]|uniref:hypothetical protein n=1 Tax=Streptomyces sp. NPDC048483 TaxID=3154927 RepID=UPI0034197FC6
MASGVLPAVDKYICSFQRWLPGHLADIADPEHAKTIRLFATWRVLPRLRVRADRSHITPSIRRFAAEQIKYATTFLQWLGERNTSLASCGQIDVDAWWAENSEHSRNGLRAFLNWAMQSRYCRRSLSIPAMKATRRAALSEDERLDALGRLLTDQDTPKNLRVAGVIVLLYAQPLTRIVRLTVNDVVHDGESVLLRLGEPASPIPEPAASLLLDYIADRDNMNTATNQASPGCSPVAGRASPSAPTTCPHSSTRSVSQRLPPAAPPSDSNSWRCPPPSSQTLSATTTRPPPASSTRPAEPGADTPLEITHGHQRVGFREELATVEYEGPPVPCPYTVLRRRTNGETVEQIQPDLLIPTDRRKGQNPSLSSICRALAEHEKTQAYPEAIEQAHADFTVLQQRDHSPK